MIEPMNCPSNEIILCTELVLQLDSFSDKIGSGEGLDWIVFYGVELLGLLEVAFWIKFPFAWNYVCG